MSVGIGIVGTGRWADAHARAASRSSEVAIVHCASRSHEARNEFADRHGIVRQSSSLDDLLADPAVDAVVISTPNDLHVAMATQVVAAGKPVLVDKPVCVDLESGLMLARAALAADVPIGVAHHARRLAGHRAAAEWLTNNGGTVRLAYANFSNARGLAIKPDAWHRSARGSAAGVLIQVGIHPIDTILALVGPATEVSARFSYGVVSPDIPDTATVMLRHTSGASSMIGSNWSTPSNYTLDLLTTNGNLLFRADHAYWTSPDVDRHSTLLLDVDGEEPARFDLTPGDPLRTQLDELGATARGTGSMSVDIWDGLRAMAVVLAATQSDEHAGAGISLVTIFERAGATPPELTRLIG